MSSNHKLVIKAEIKKHITEYYHFDCTGMSIDEVNSAMELTYIEGLPEWECVNWETDHSEISMKLEIEAVT